MATRRDKKTGPEHVYAVLQDFDTMMVGTSAPVGQPPRLTVRPMTVARLDQDCTLYFLGRAEPGQPEASPSPQSGAVIGQRRGRYVSAHGHFEVLKDSVRAQALWSPAFEAWFDGPDDPALVVMIFHPEEVELWDSKGLKGLRYAFDRVRARVTGERAAEADAPELHERVRLH